MANRMKAGVVRLLRSNEELDAYYNKLAQVRGFPPLMLKAIARELSFRKAWKPTETFRYSPQWDMDLNYANCPRCNKTLKSGRTNTMNLARGYGTRYELCPWCGQHIDWSEWETIDPRSLENLKARANRQIERERRERGQSFDEEADVAGLEDHDD